jgi:urease accessory protein
MELSSPCGPDAVAYFVGFVLATGLLHLAGVALGLTVRWPPGRIGVRAVGAAIACIGIAFLWRLA